MLFLLEGAFNSGVHDELKALIESNIKNFKKSILIVPEQQTVIAEKEFASTMPSNAPLFFEVTNFTRFANTAFRKLGGIQKKYADSAKKSLIMWQALTELSPFLSEARVKRDVNASVTERALNAVKEAETLGLDSSSLIRLSENKDFGSRLCGKLADLSKILAFYKEKLRSRYADTADDWYALVKKLKEEKEFLNDTDIFIDGFTSFTAPQYSLLCELILHSTVTITLNIPKFAPDSYEYSELEMTRGKLVSLCDKSGVDKKIIKIDGRKNVKSDLLFDICPLLWKSNIKLEHIERYSLDDLRIFEAKDPFEECEFIASDIRRRVIDGASYKDFAIVMGNSSDYDGILDAALDKADIVHFTSAKSDLMSFEAVKFVFSALSASRTFSRSDIITYASCGFSGISRDECCEFDMYTDKWQIEAQRFTDGFVWNMNPLGFESKKLPDHDEILKRIDATRVKLITPLMMLNEDMTSAKTIKDHATALIKFLEKTDLEGKLIIQAKKLNELGEKHSADDNLKLYEIICTALDTLVDTAGDTRASRESFSAQLKIVFSASQIGRIPSSYDEVMIGTADMLRLLGTKHVYLIGTNYGKFPAPQSSGTYFSDKERATLALSGIDIGADTEISTARSLFAFSRTFASASQSVTITYPRTDSSFSGLSPSFVIENITHLTDGRIIAEKTADIPPRDKFYASQIAYESLNECSEEDKKQIKSVLSELNGDTVFSDGELISNGDLHLSEFESKEILYLTQTRIDTFLSCPLKYFCRFTLSLSEAQRARFGANNIGSYIHAILENFFSEIKSSGMEISSLSEAEKSEMTLRAAKAYLNTFSNEIDVSGARVKYALGKIYRSAKPIIDGICKEFEVSAFTPVFFELPISKIAEEGPTPVEICGKGGEKICVYGTIDRVDTYKSGNDVYVRVVDYKTGSKDFDPNELPDGKNLQMFLYLKSILECKKPSFKKAMGVFDDGKLLPAGLVYLKTDIGDKHINTLSDALAEEAIGKAQKRMGMVLADSEIMQAMGEEFLPVKLTKSGVYKNHEKFLFTKDSWEDISNTVETAVADIGHRIATGEIRAVSGSEARKKSPCEHCEYKAFCRNLKL